MFREIFTIRKKKIYVAIVVNLHKWCNYFPPSLRWTHWNIYSVKMWSMHIQNTQYWNVVWTVPKGTFSFPPPGVSDKQGRILKNGIPHYICGCQGFNHQSGLPSAFSHDTWQLTSTHPALASINLSAFYTSYNYSSNSPKSLSCLAQFPNHLP